MSASHLAHMGLSEGVPLPKGAERRIAFKLESDFSTG